MQAKRNGPKLVIYHNKRMLTIFEGRSQAIEETHKGNGEQNQIIRRMS